MMERAEVAQNESDTSYYFELLYMGELVIKILLIEILASMEDEREQYRHALEYRLVRANGIGEWAEALDEALTGPPSQHLTQAARESQQAITSNYGPGTSTWQRHAVDELAQACRLLDPTVADASQQRVNLRQWIRQFVWLRNRTRGHGATKPDTLSRMCPDLQKSIDLVIDNAPAFGRSWSFLKRNLSGKYRVSSFGGDRRPFEYLTKQADHSLPDGVYVFLQEPRRGRLLFSDPDLADFYLPNGNFHHEMYEVFSYITDERRYEDGSQYVLPVYGRPVSETAAAPELDVIGNAFTNMPPKRGGYVKRPALETQLTALLSDDRHPLITLQGRGGVGKTSLALEVLHRIAEEESCYIIWFSARDIDLLPEGPRVVRPDVLSIEDLANDFKGIMRPGLTVKRRDAEAYLTDSLSGQEEDGPFIFVFDNFETIRQQSELFAYLSNAIRLPNKVLITTRTRDFKADYPIEVRGMTREEFTELVHDVSERLSITALINSEYEEQLFEESDGHPYITKILLGEVANAGRRVSLKRIIATKDALLDALFDRSFAALSPAAQRVFLTLCSWRSLVPQIGIEAVLLRPGNERVDVEHALAELEQSSLVEVVTSGDAGGEFISVPLAAALFGRKKLVTSPLKIAIDADLELIRGFGPTTTTDLGHGLASRIDRLARAAAARAEDGADLAQELAVLEYIASEYPYAWLRLADLYEEVVHDSPKAIHAVNRYLEENPHDQDAWRQLIGLYGRTDDVLGEMHARLQLAELAAPSFHDLSSAANRLNGLLSRQEIEIDADERHLMVEKLRRLMEDRNSEANATDLSRLAWLCMYDKDRAAAERWVDEGLRRDPGNEYCQRLKEKLATDRQT
jgi:tetratricopeptide (TPR) repeat protein